VSKLLTQETRGVTLELGCQLRRGHARIALDKHVHVIRHDFQGSDLAAIDPVERIIVPLFNPRLQHWSHHFQLVGVRIVGLTPVGRATIALLRLNDDARLIDRQMLSDARLYPPLHL
jgi:hypothetical protein